MEGDTTAGADLAQRRVIGTRKARGEEAKAASEDAAVLLNLKRIASTVLGIATKRRRRNTIENLILQTPDGDDASMELQFEVIKD